MADSYRIKITSEALSDLQGIFTAIHKDSPQGAAGMVEKILNQLDSLDTMPSRFKVVGRSRSTNLPVHAVVVRPYIVYYRVDEARDWVFVMSVRHGARRQPRRFP